MKFKRINMDTVRCLITEDELIENGLEVDDFLQNDGKTESFLRKIISMAEEEVGYKVKGGNISIQVSVLPEHTLALTFSEKPAEGIMNMLENLKSAVENLSKIPKDKEKKRVDDSNLLDRPRADEQAVTPKNTEKPKPMREAGSPDNKNAIGGQKSDYQIQFDSLDQFTAYCNAILLEVPVDNSLYRMEREKSYYLLMKKAPMTDKQLCKLLSASLEFSESIYSHPATKAYVEEHGEPIIPERAIQVMQEIS